MSSCCVELNHLPPPPPSKANKKKKMTRCPGEDIESKVKMAGGEEEEEGGQVS